jgi:sugar phosphate isomerase/epimerase
MLESAAGAIEPIARQVKPRFKLSLSAYSYRDLLMGSPPRLTLADFVDECAKLGVEGTELTFYYFPDPISDAYLQKLKQQCFLLGMDISGTAVRNDFALPPGEERQRQIEWVKKWVDYAEFLGAPVIRIFAGEEQEGLSPERVHSLIVSGIEECCDYAGNHGVYLALENHGGPTLTIEGMMSFVRDVKSPWFGVNLDTGNFPSQDPYSDLEQLAPYAVNVQIKASMKDEHEQKTPSDYTRLAKILREADYSGYIVLEYEDAGDPQVECPKILSQLREAFA